LIDLTGAKTPKARQIPLLRKLPAAVDLPVHVGGGISNEQDRATLLEAGATRVVIVSSSVKQPRWVQRWLTGYGIDAVVLALNMRTAISGWQDNSSTTLEQVIEQFLPYGPEEYVVHRHFARWHLGWLQRGTVSGNHPPLPAGCLSSLQWHR